MVSFTVNATAYSTLQIAHLSNGLVFILVQRITMANFERNNLFSEKRDK